MAAFAEDSERSIERIYRELLANRFSFSPAKGVFLKRPNKKSRPLVVSTIPDRIVQRSILDVLQAQPSIQNFIKVPTSFGGIETRGVGLALENAYRAMQREGKYFIRTDIKSFFTKIPRDMVLQKIGKSIEDTAFNDLLKQAVTTELSNLQELKESAAQFPLWEIGVAQGCCLSPLFGNILLYDFDVRMNRDGVVCLRYIDDFIVMGRDRKTVRAAFNKAKRDLGCLELEVYDPEKEKDKAEEGFTKNGFEFLGCKVVPGLIGPNKKSRERLLKSIKELFDKSIQLMSNPVRASREKATYADTLIAASRILKGWGDHYSFCNDGNMMAMLDTKVDEQLSEYCSRYEEMKRNVGRTDPMDQRRLLGVHLLADRVQKSFLCRGASGAS